MAKCETIRMRHRKLCSGDLIHSIKVLDKSVLAPAADSVDYTVEFDTDDKNIIYAWLDTPRGKTMFDDTDTEREVTHIWGVYYDPAFTMEKVVLFDGRYFEVLDVNDLEERHEWMFLTTTERGITSNAANN